MPREEKGKHGGKRPGAGRKKSKQQYLTCSVSLTPEQVRRGKLLGGNNLSAGLRWLLDVTKPFIRLSQEALRLDED